MTAVVKTLVSGSRKLVINVTGVFSASDETDTNIIDRSTLTGPGGLEPTDIKIDEITWAVGSGFDYVMLEWDHTTDEVIDYFQGQGYMDYRHAGGKKDGNGSGGTGDLLLTTAGGAAGDTYSLLINCTLTGKS
jgi:hypothetical protein